MEVKKAKLEEKSTQTETASTNGTSNHTSGNCVPLLTSLPLGGGPNDIPKHQRRSSHISDLPSPQSVIVKMNNNNPNIVCTVKPTAVNKSASIVSSLASAPVLPSESNIKDGHAPTKTVVFIDETTPEIIDSKPANKSNADQDQQRGMKVSVNSQSNAPNNSISNGPAVPLNLTDSSIRDVAL